MQGPGHVSTMFYYAQLVVSIAWCEARSDSVAVSFSNTSQEPFHPENLKEGYLLCRWWVVGGLGARGLVYHAWLGELVVQAVLSDSEAALPSQLLRWKSAPPL